MHLFRTIIQCDNFIKGASLANCMPVGYQGGKFKQKPECEMPVKVGDITEVSIVFASRNLAKEKALTCFELLVVCHDKKMICILYDFLHFLFLFRAFYVLCCILYILFGMYHFKSMNPLGCMFCVVAAFLLLCNVDFNAVSTLFFIIFILL